ncbi:MAG: formate dehydrogenase accessory sulfurtransferase FdhD [Opitutaceae bacterium]
MSLAQATRTFFVTHLDGVTDTKTRGDALATEEPLEIRVAGRSVAVVMRTPGHDRELAAGFLVTEKLIRHRDDVLDMTFCDDIQPDGITIPPGPRENILNVVLAPYVAVDFARLSRNVFTSSSCGICSKASIDAVRALFPPIAHPLSPSRRVLASLPEQLRAAQTGFAATGGSHASALFDADGKLLAVREDVGRHNALDKIIGHAFFADRLPLAGHILLVSGRVSFEIVQKALAAGIPCLAAISAPTTAAVELARDSGQTLVGFLRGERMNVYAGTLAK